MKPYTFPAGCSFFGGHATRVRPPSPELLDSRRPPPVTGIWAKSLIRRPPRKRRAARAGKANAAERLLEGVSAVTPAGAALGILPRTEPTKFKVAIGEYKEMIDQRIALIK